MKRSSTAQAAVTLKGKWTSVKDAIAIIKAAEAASKKKYSDDSIAQMHRERRSRMIHQLRWRAQNGDTEAATALSRNKL